MSPVLPALAVAAGVAAAGPALAAKKALAPGERIDLNRASVSELMRLPGTGERRAQAIVAQRARQPFRRVEDVLAVKGLGRGWLARVKGRVVVAPPAPQAALAREGEDRVRGDPAAPQRSSRGIAARGPLGP